MSLTARVEVLSVIAQQILTITKAKKENLFHFEGTYEVEPKL